jgi:endo-1,4-beta-xylanase
MSKTILIVATDPNIVYLLQHYAEEKEEVEMSGKRSFARKRGNLFSILVVVGLVLASCAPKPPTPRPTKTPTPLPTATETPTPLPPDTPTPTPTPISTEPTPTPPGGDTIVYDFEDGTTQGWGPRGDGVEVSVVSDTAQSGSSSLLIANRTQNWHGVMIDVMGLLEPDATYEFSAFVKLAEGAPASRIILTMQRTPSGGDTQYEWIAPSAEDGVTDADWVELKGQYSFTGEVTELILYLESPDAELVDFYLDHVTIAKKTSGGGPLSQYDFEDGTTQGWGPRGDAQVTVPSEAAHSGSNSLKITGRTANWNGASINVLNLLQPDVTYQFSAFVRLAAGAPPSRVILSMQRTPTGGSTQYDWIAPSAEDGVTDADWVELTGQYSFTGEVSELILYLESPDAELVDFYVDDITISGAPPRPPVQLDIPSVYETLADYFPMGAAIEPDQLDSADHVTLLTRHFNSITPENAMKPGPIQPSEGNFQWAGPDRLVTFARENNIAVHGHTLVWHSQGAEWMFEDSSGNPLEPTPENKELVLERLETHIRAVVGRYKDDVNVWDVVNEVIDESQTDCMRRSRWYELTGTDYIVKAFQVADEVAPDAALLINDYSLEQPAKRTCMYEFVQELLDQGVPVDGIGTQMHVNIENPSVEAIEETITLFASLGVKVHVTELDMSIYTDDSSSYTTVPPEILNKQGHRYKDIFEVFRRHADSIGSVTFWGLADDHTWLKTFPITRLNLPLLFDEQLQAKPAYWGVVDPSKLPILIQQITAFQGTPTVDGNIDNVWNMQAWTSLEGTETFSARFKPLWDEQNLYLLVDVQDSTQDPQDLIEIFVDQNNSKSATYEADDLHYTCQDGTCTPSDTIQYSVQATADGYLVEAALTLSEGTAVDKLIGFDLRITDSAAPNAPIVWNDVTNSQDTSTVNFGTLVLAEAVKLTIALEGTPVIDAEEDAVWATANEISTEVWVAGSQGSTAKVRTLWDSEHLYVYAVVTDSLLSKASPNAWEQDSIEIFLDQNHARTTSYQPDDAQYRLKFDNELSFNGGSADLISSATKVTPDGYIVELAITLNVVQPADGVTIGFDFQVNNDEDGDGDRDSVAMWQDPTGQSYQNTSKFGILQFASNP